MNAPLFSGRHGVSRQSFARLILLNFNLGWPFAPFLSTCLGAVLWAFDSADNHSKLN